jgi:hypothetical protein
MTSVPAPKERFDMAEESALLPRERISMKRPPEPVKPWRDVLQESFGHVQAIGGLFALDFEYYLESESNRCYRLLWTNRLDAETKSGRLVCDMKAVWFA